MSTKSLLQDARKAIDSQDYALAIQNCTSVLDQDPNNYNAWVFLGLSKSKMAAYAESQSAFERAVDLQPNVPLAHQGLLSLYSAQNAIPSQIQVLQRLRCIYLESNDANKYLDTLQKLLKTVGSSDHYLDELHVWEFFLPESQGFDLIKDLEIPNLLQVWRNIARLQDLHDTTTLERALEAERFRIRSESLQTIRQNLERELILKSRLGEALEYVARLTTDEQEANASKMKLLDFLFKMLKQVTSNDQKTRIFDRLLELSSSGLQASLSQLPAYLYFELQDFSFHDYNRDLVHSVITNFPDTPLSRVCLIIGAIDSQSMETLVSMLPEESLDLQDLHESAFAHQILAFAYDASGDCERSIEHARTSKANLSKLEIITAKCYSRRTLELDLLIANRLQKLGGAYLADALSAYRSVLDRDSKNVDALQGLCDVMISLKNLEEASKFAHTILEIHSENHKAEASLGWIHFLKNEYQEAVTRLQSAISKNGNALNMYRIGKVYWAMGGNYKTDKSFALSYFLQSAKKDAAFAPAFSSLGLYYDQVEHDKTRSNKCFRRALQLDPSNAEASKELVQILLRDGNLVESQMILKNYCALCPRNEWAHRQLGLLYFNAGHYQECIDHFHSALRLNDRDSFLWECLGEALTQEGKYTAAIKALNRALAVSENASRPTYLLGCISLKLGLYLDAIHSFDSVLVSKPDHLPTLKSLAESYFQMAKGLFVEGSYGAGLDALASAMSISFKGASINTSISHIFYKLIGDTALEMVRNSVCDIQVSGDEMDRLITSFNAFEVVPWLFENGYRPNAESHLHKLLSCSVIAYISAIQYFHGNPNIQAMYHYDISVALHQHFLSLKADKYLNWALQAVKISIKVSPSSSYLWDAAGIYLSNLDTRLSQHAFIQAVQISRSSRAWSNLGFLYLLQGDLEIASTAFSQSSLIDPEYVLPWIGRILVSKETGRPDLLELLEHSQELSHGSEPELNYLYLHHLLQESKVPKDSFAKNIFYLQNSFHLNLIDLASLNTLALAHERQGNYENAVTVLKRAWQQIEDLVAKNPDRINDPIVPIIIANFSRVLCSAGLYREAIEMSTTLRSLSSPDAFTLAIEGLALFFAGDWESALITFESAITASSTFITNEILITLGRLVYSMGIADGINIAKDQFFRWYVPLYSSQNSITSDSKNIQALFSLLSLGMISNDDTLCQSVLVELHSIPSDILLDEEFDTTYFLSRYALWSKNKTLCRSLLLKSVHQDPNNIQSWYRLSKFLLESPEFGIKTACRVTESCRRLLDSNSDAASPNLSSEVSRIYGLSLLALGPRNNASRNDYARSCQNSRNVLLKAIRACPSSSYNWITLAIHSASTKSPIAPRVIDIARILGGNWETQLPLVEFQNRLSSSSDQQHLDSLIEDLKSVDSANINYTILLQLSLAYYRKCDFSRSVSVAKAALRITPSACGLDILANIYESQNLMNAAVSCRKIALDSYCSSDAERIPILLRLGKTYLNLNDGKAVSETISTLNLIDADLDACKLMQAVLQRRNGNTARCQKILDTMGPETEEWKSWILSR